jgi:type IV pilus assembly protein PilQ
MKFKNKTSYLLIPFLILLLTGCADKMAKKKVFKHDTPLIKTDVKELGKKELEKSAEMGPIPIEGDVIKLKKRKQLSSVK